MQKNRSLILMACLAMLAVFFSETVIFAKPPTQASDVTFKTPEDAITAYMEGMAQADFTKILQACAIDEMSENFRFDLYIERVRAWSVQALSPTDSPLYVELNKAQLTSQFSTQVKIFTYSLLSTEEMGDGRTIIMDADQAAKFMKEIDLTRLTSLKVEKIGLPNETIMSGERYKENVAKTARVYGADEFTERVVLFTFEQNYYYIGFTLLRYGDNWKINSQASSMANTRILGNPEKTTEAAFDEMISGN